MGVGWVGLWEWGRWVYGSRVGGLIGVGWVDL